MELKQRLAVLRRQRGGTAAAPTTVSVAQRLQRLSGSAASGAADPDRTADVARLLAGTPVDDGLIVVERQVPLAHQHGRRCFASWLAPAHTVPSIDRPLPAEGLVFMDTETTGLAGGTGTLAFLLGLGRIVDHTLCLRQFFLTGFRGEAALLRAVRDWVADGEYLVTFNGKSFDAPLLATRYRLAGIPDPFAPLHHVDLFHPTRRAFGSRWPDCRLQTAERRLLGFQRHDDLPAYLVPEVWFAFVRHGTTHQLPGILDHNRWDLLSLIALLPALAEVFTTPGEAGADVVAVARYWLQRGDEPAALLHLQTHQAHLTAAGLLELARLYRRRQTWGAAVPIWRHLADQDCLEALERLAKYYEHVQRDYHTALRFTHRLQHLDRQNRGHTQRAQRLVTKLGAATTAWHRPGVQI